MKTEMLRIPTKGRKAKASPSGTKAGLGYFFFYVLVIAAVVLSILLTISLPIIRDTTLERDALHAALTQRIEETVIYAYIAAYLAKFLLLWLFFILRKKKFFQEIRLTRVKFTTLCPLISLGFAMRLSIAAITALLPKAWTGMTELAMDTLAGGWSLPIMLLAVVMPFTREVVCRGLVYTRFSKAQSRWLAIIFSSVLCGIGGHPVQTVLNIGFAVTLCLVMDRYGSLWAPVVMQMSSFILGGLATSILIGVPPVSLLFMSAAVCGLSVILILRQTKPKAQPEQPGKQDEYHQ